MPPPFSAEALLEAISGVAYVVDCEGVIQGFSRGPFLPEMRRSGMAIENCKYARGTSIFSIIQGEAVRRSYRSLHEAAWSGRSDAFGFTYRCDAPDVERHMFMSISRIAEGASTVALLYQSVTLSELYRAPLPLFAFETLPGPGIPADRIVTLCSYCQMVAWPAGGQSEWIDAVEFYRRGGSSDVVVSHGICDACIRRVVGPAERMV